MLRFTEAWPIGFCITDGICLPILFGVENHPPASPGNMTHGKGHFITTSFFSFTSHQAVLMEIWWNSCDSTPSYDELLLVFPFAWSRWWITITFAMTGENKNTFYDLVNITGRDCWDALKNCELLLIIATDVCGTYFTALAILLHIRTLKLIWKQNNFDSHNIYRVLINLTKI